MKIKDIRKEETGPRARIAAAVLWEDCDRPTQEIFFETDAEFGDGLAADPHPFLIGGILPALRNGERRLAIEGEVCPALAEGLRTATAWLRHWYYPPATKSVQIEAKTRDKALRRAQKERAGFFFSGGIDALATLRYNRLHVPSTHPLSLQDGLLIYGQNIESDNRPETFNGAVKALSAVAEDASITLIPVYTNVRALDEDIVFFGNEFHGAIMGAVAHALGARLTSVAIGASNDIPMLSLIGAQHMKPLGSHPLLDPWYSSAELSVRHENLILSRLAKTRLVADWETAFQHIKVCQPNWPGSNCGRCEKCVRTMLALEALGLLEKCRAFPAEELTAERVARTMLKRPTLKQSYSVEGSYLELIEPLKERGRTDLVEAIELLLMRYRYEGIGLKAKLKRFDEQHLHGSLLKVKRLCFAEKIPLIG